MEKIEFGGIKGQMLSAQTVQIFDEFQEQYKVFTDSSYDCLDLSDQVCQFFMFIQIHKIYKMFIYMSCMYYNISTIIVFWFQSFPNDYEKFKSVISDLDRRLSAIVMQGFDDCSALEAMFKV